MFYAAVPLAIILDEAALFGLMGVYLIYIIWSCCHSATKYVNGLQSIAELFKNVDLAIRAPPSISMHI